MAIQESKPSLEGIPYRAKQSWDVGAISQALNHPPEPAQDIAHGPGVRYALADGALTIELFPPHAERCTGIVRLSTADSLQEFYRQPQPALRDEGIIFETSQLLISVSSTGELMTYRIVPDEGAEEPSDGPDCVGEVSDPSRDDEGPGGDSAASGTPFQNVLAETEGQPRVTYSGRLGTDPRTKMTPKGKLVMEFPVAVAVEGLEKPDWKNTVVFDEKATKLEGVLVKGMGVEVVAYEHRKLTRDAKTGKQRERVEYYATSVSPRSRKTSADRGATGND